MLKFFIGYFLGASIMGVGLIIVMTTNYILPKSEWSQVKEKERVWAYVEGDLKP